jgi:ABC-2 type transport system permease protein
MFLHIFGYRLKILLYDKGTMFWTLAFPVLLATLFHLAFGQLGAQETFKAIDVAVVDSGNDAAFLSVVQSLSTGDERLFNLSLTTKEAALGLLATGEVKGIIETGAEMSLTVSQSGIQQSILQTFLNNYTQTLSAVSRIGAKRPELLTTLSSLAAEHAVFLVEQPISRAAPKNLVIPFFSLLAMTCLMGGFLGMNEVNAVQANLSAQAMRLSVTPVHKLRTFLAGLSAALVVQFAKLMLFLAFLVYILSIDFGDRLALVLVAVFLCTLLGLACGAFVTSLVKGTESLKTGILIAVSVIGSHLAGMSSPEIKYLVEKYVPPLAWLNPASLVTDTFYTLYYFDTLSRFSQSVAGVIAFTALFAGATYFVIRRQRYVSL